MGNRDNARNKLRRLSRTLEALASDLDARERRMRTLVRNIAPDSRGARGVEAFVDHFAFVVERAKSGPKP
jgi:hypothetical protein